MSSNRKLQNPATGDTIILRSEYSDVTLNRNQREERRLERQCRDLDLASRLVTSDITQQKKALVKSLEKTRRVSSCPVSMLRSGSVSESQDTIASGEMNLEKNANMSPDNIPSIVLNFAADGLADFGLSRSSTLPAMNLAFQNSQEVAEQSGNQRTSAFRRQRSSLSEQQPVMSNPHDAAANSKRKSTSDGPIGSSGSPPHLQPPSNRRSVASGKRKSASDIVPVPRSTSHRQWNNRSISFSEEVPTDVRKSETNTAKGIDRLARPRGSLQPDRLSTTLSVEDQGHQKRNSGTTIQETMSSKLFAEQPKVSKRRSLSDFQQIHQPKHA